MIYFYIYTVYIVYEWDGEWSEVQVDNETCTDLQIQTKLKHQRIGYDNTLELSTKILAVTGQFQIRPKSQGLLMSGVKQRTG